jgi:hypothetical protein
MNAQTGKEDIYYPTIGKHSLHNHSNDNGLRLINLQHQEAWLLAVPYFNIDTYIRVHGSLQMDK